MVDLISMVTIFLSRISGLVADINQHSKQLEYLIFFLHVFLIDDGKRTSSNGVLGMRVFVDDGDDIGCNQFARLDDDSIDEGEFFAQIGVNMDVANNLCDKLAAVHGDLVGHYRLN